MLKKILKALENIVKTLIISSGICSVLTFSLIIINSLMGIHIGLRYYLIMFTILTLCLGLGLTLYNCDSIFTYKPAVKKQVAPKKRKSSKENKRVQTRVKRKIS